MLVAFVGMQPIIATLILMVAGRGVAQLLTGGQIIPIGAPGYLFVGGGYLAGRAVFGVDRDRRGAGDRAAHRSARRSVCSFARSASIRWRRAWSACARRRSSSPCMRFSGLTAAMAGILISSNVRSADGNNAGLLLELDAILAVTLGGTSLLGGRFSLAGTVLGALIIQTLTYTTYSIGVPPEATLVVKAAVVLAVSVIQSPSARAARRMSRVSARTGWPDETTCSMIWARVCRSAHAADRRHHPAVLRVVRLRLGDVHRLLLAAGAAGLLVDNAFLLIVAIGMTFVIVSGGIDLSVGSVVALTTIVAAVLSERLHCAGLGDRAASCW